MVKENGLKVNGVKEVARGGDSRPQAQAVVEVPQQQSQGSTVCWERFLNIRSLKVLLVEYDDSTRHVVAALLRNCSYEVIEAGNGIQAWKVLEDLSNNIDIILTEVVMPCLSGIGLLSKIMSHKSRKNIPVIMMSSHDSMGLVFRCLSKGAVDFLVKPIRKNELKNLWQHVWRRCQSSSGSGSESGTQTQKSVRSKSVNRSDNNTGSNEEDENWSNGQNAGDGSDSGSGAQSSWTKQAVEVDSPQPEASWDHIPECPDSTCAQVIHSNAEMCGDKQVHAAAAIDCPEENEKLGSVGMHKEHEIGKHRNLDVQLEYPVEPIKVVGSKQANQLAFDSRKFSKEINKGQLDLNKGGQPGYLQCETADLTGIISNSTDRQVDSTEAEAPNRVSNASDDKAFKETKESSLVDLSLKRVRGVKDTGKEIQADRNVLRRSDSSAFSRYNTASNAIKIPTGNVGSSSLHDNSSEIIKQEPVCNIRSYSSEDPPNQCSGGGSNNADMGSTTNNAFSKPEVTKNKSVAMSADKPLHQSDAFQKPLKNNSVSFSHLQSLDKTNSYITVCAPKRGTHPALQDQQLHHCDQAHSLVHKKQLPSGHYDLALNKMAASLPHCSSSNMLPTPVEGNAGNYSINGSASGSNNGVNPGGTNGESDNGIAGKSGSGDGSGSGTGNGVDQDKAARRVAALNKFRQKRKERCFRRKVRYQSRKRLAEQRPRVRGQFVRKMSNESTSTTNESTSGDTDD